MKLQEMLDKIQEALLKGDILHARTEANIKLFTARYGEFEAILSGNGDEKYLVPETAGLLHFLYRGQNEEYIPCFPSIHRGNPSDADIFIERMRLTVFNRTLQSHPVVRHFFNRHHFVVDVEGLAQHYGLKTSVLDLTSSLDVALFFATCKYDRETDTYSCYNDNETHDAILYVFNPIYDNEPIPPQGLRNYMRGNIRPIGLQAFPRPGAQEGYALHIPQGGSIKCWMYKFTFNSNESKYYYEKFNEGKTLWIHDSLIPKTKEIAEQTDFSFSVFDETYNNFHPKGFSKTQLKKRINSEFPRITFAKHIPDVVFSEGERFKITKEWNEYLGRDVCKRIVRKVWFNHDSINKETNKIQGITNHSEYRTFDHLTSLLFLKLIAAPDGPEGAIWYNYNNTPRPKEKILPEDGQWKKIDSEMFSMFGNAWLTEEDWLIKI